MANGKLFSFHFDCGNSTNGAIGFCARIRAETKQGALAILRRVLPTEMKVRPVSQADDPEQSRKDDAAIEYIECYISPDNIKLDDIDDGEEVEP